MQLLTEQGYTPAAKLVPIEGHALEAAVELALIAGIGLVLLEKGDLDNRAFERSFHLCHINGSSSSQLQRRSLMPRSRPRNIYSHPIPRNVPAVKVSCASLDWRG